MSWREDEVFGEFLIDLSWALNDNTRRCMYQAWLASRAYTLEAAAGVCDKRREWWEKAPIQDMVEVAHASEATTCRDSILELHSKETCPDCDPCSDHPHGLCSKHRSLQAPTKDLDFLEACARGDEKGQIVQWLRETGHSDAADAVEKDWPESDELQQKGLE